MWLDAHAAESHRQVRLAGYARRSAASSDPPEMHDAIQGYPDPGDGLRLHLNENTGGCSPRVLEAIQRGSQTTDVSTLSVVPRAGACASARALRRRSRLGPAGLTGWTKAS